PIGPPACWERPKRSVTLSARRLFHHSWQSTSSWWRGCAPHWARLTSPGPGRQAARWRWRRPCSWHWTRRRRQAGWTECDRAGKWLLKISARRGRPVEARAALAHVVYNLLGGLVHLLHI